MTLVDLNTLQLPGGTLRRQGFFVEEEKVTFALENKLHKISRRTRRIRAKAVDFPGSFNVFGISPYEAEAALEKRSCDVVFGVSENEKF